MSAAERDAWEALRLLRAEGIHIVRQHEIGRYRVDFAIRKQRIAIEIDGGVHQLPGRPDYDAARQAQIEAMGWRMLRIDARITHDPDRLLDIVRKYATPSPSRGGGRGWGEPPASQILAPDAEQDSNVGGSPRPHTPSPQGEGGRRRTRASRKLPSRIKP